MVLRLTSRSPRRPCFVVTVACAPSRRLDASIGASEPHDLAVRISIIRPARIRSPDAAASTASLPAFVTFAKRPSVGRDSDRYRSDLGQARNEIFLQKGLDRPFRKTRSDLPVGQFCRSNSVIARNDRHEAIHTCLAESRIASQSLSPLIGPRFPAGLLGLRQVERQWILIPPYGGSNPPAPASFNP